MFEGRYLTLKIPVENVHFFRAFLNH
eukprot:UN18427